MESTLQIELSLYKLILSIDLKYSNVFFIKKG